MCFFVQGLWCYFMGDGVVFVSAGASTVGSAPEEEEGDCGGEEAPPPLCAFSALLEPDFLMP